jgi:purine-binding chemotaxis protein CheW
MNALSLSRQTDPAPTPAGAALVIFAGGREFAIYAGAVQTIARVGAMARIPGTPAFVLGVANIHGQILPIQSLGRRLFPGRGDVEDGASVVVVEARGRAGGLVVQSVGTVVLAAASDVLPPPAGLDPQIAPFTTAVLRRDGALAPIIDVGALLEYPLGTRDIAARSARRNQDGG